MKFASASMMALMASTTLIGIALPSHSQAQTSPQMALFEEVDTNHDGYIDLAEDNAANEKRFKKFDQNGDGKFSRAEMLAANKKFGQSEQMSNQVAQLYLSRMDKDGDDAASWSEFKTWTNQNMFAALDRDHDGRISKEEFIVPPSPEVP